MAPMTHVLQSMFDKEPFVTEPPICVIQKGQTRSTFTKLFRDSSLLRGTEENKAFWGPVC